MICRHVCLRIVISLLIGALALPVVCAAQQTPGPHVVDLPAPDGVILKASFFAAAQPGPGVLLLHQCNRQRKVWDDLAGRLAASGVNVLTMDFRGFGESGGTASDKMPPEEVNQIVRRNGRGTWTWRFVICIAQPGVSRDCWRRWSELRRESGGAIGAAASGSEVVDAAV